jgi:hypothetical protein
MLSVGYRVYRFTMGEGEIERSMCNNFLPQEKMKSYASRIC